ncbi:MAG TPA: SPOR domain-containing protein [Gemmatimonadales bacterium]|nr:SPOR domain-containing protein [Gemmatimonadales bacterium]
MKSLVSLFLLALLLSPARASAQEDPRLVEAVRVAREGLADSARAMTARLLGSTASSASLYPEILFTIAIVAANEQDRRLYLRRVAIEHSTSPWADNALLELAQLEYATGNVEGTVRLVDQLLSDFPASDVTAEAAFWGARAAFDRNDGTRACAWLATGVVAAGTDVELRNQLEFLNLRCQGPVAESGPPVSPAPTPAPAPAPPPPPPPTTRPTAGPAWYVQVAALGDRVAIDRTVESLRQMGYEPVVLPGPGALQRVVAGRFSTRALAQAEVARVRSRFGGQPFVISVP